MNNDIKYIPISCPIINKVIMEILDARQLLDALKGSRLSAKASINISAALKCLEGLEGELELIRSINNELRDAGNAHFDKLESHMETLSDFVLKLNNESL